MKYLVTMWFWVVFTCTLPLGTALTAVWAWAFGPQDAHRNRLHLWLSFWGHGYLRVNPFWKVQVFHRELLPKGPVILVANHQSMADIFAVMGLSYPFKFVSKASVFSVPFVGWMMRLAGYVAIERGRVRSTQQMMEACRVWLKKGVSVLLFPEGTYSPDGKMLPFKRGAFQLAMEENVPVVPIHIDGTRSLVVEDGPWLSEKCHIQVTVLPPVFVDEFQDAGALSHHVRALLENASLSNGR